MMTKKNQQNQVSFITVDETHVDRRLDNFLISHFGSLPKTRIYKMIRKGEVRVNKGRIKQNYRLQAGDTVRIPPVYILPEQAITAPSAGLSALIQNSIIYEDERLVVINKPANVAVHSGSGIKHGVIEILRAQRGETQFLELVHRLDRATSGCLLIAKDHKTLRAMHDMLKSGQVEKNYLALLQGQLTGTIQTVDMPLLKMDATSGERKVVVNNSGKQAITHFHLLERFNTASLCRVELITGRTHQIRVHASHINQPLAGDEKYGDWGFNRAMKKSGLKRLFLHAQTLSFEIPDTKKSITLKAPLPKELEQCLDKLA